jgi:putative colanic acid biosynthesis UDP-glucose lipid carrier transferase
VTRQAHGAQVESGLLLLDLQKPPFSERGSLAKAVLDYTVACVAIVVLAPLMSLIALAIKVDSRGPVFFVQSRHGYNNRIIRVFKFRTMTCADDGPIVPQASRNDERVTRIGRLLRRTSLDELPQLMNVLRGELSLVGPRPHAVCHNDLYAASLATYTNRHKVKPGITGWAQVHGCRGATESADAMRKRLDLDLFYINQWSLWLDIKILARTLAIPFYDNNAY